MKYQGLYHHRENTSPVSYTHLWTKAASVPRAQAPDGSGTLPASLLISSSSLVPNPTLLIFITSSGPMLLEVELPPTAPQPRVSAGNRPVVAPMPPRAPGVFTRILEAGTARAKDVYKRQYHSLSPPSSLSALQRCRALLIPPI